LYSDNKEGEMAEYADKSILSFTEELLAVQITLIEQNFFSSIRPRECLCTNWDNPEVEAPNIIGMRANYELVRRWALTEVLKQPNHEDRYYALTWLIILAEVNFSDFFVISAFAKTFKF
jgi:hypothetical protein